MKRRSLVSLIVSCILLVLGAGLAFAIVLAAASVALASHQNAEERQSSVSPVVPNPSAGSSFSGMITDSHCGARHLRNSHLSSAECARACVRKGASYVLIDGEKRYALSGSDDVLGKLAGARANVTGARQGETILVNSAAPLF